MKIRDTKRLYGYKILRRGGFKMPRFPSSAQRRRALIRSGASRVKYPNTFNIMASEWKWPQ